MMEIRVSGCRGFGFVELAINSRMFFLLRVNGIT